MWEVLSKYPSSQGERAFSLIEVVLAMGIISCSCATLLGLLGSGLLTVNRAVGTTVQAQIIQAIINDSQVHSYDSGYTTNMYFSDQGTVVAQSDSTQLYAAKINAVPLRVGGATGYTLNAANSGSILEIAVTNRAVPGYTNSFSLIWCNSGN